jgi:hypothetical protein
MIPSPITLQNYVLMLIKVLINIAEANVVTTVPRQIQPIAPVIEKRMR